MAKVLVVDDNRLNTMLLEQILEDEDYEVDILVSGERVVEVSKESKPDAILLDIMMPGIDGFEVCRLLKEEPETKDIPVIMVTAKTEGEDLNKAFELGAFDYIKKPIDEVEVIARLKSALKYRSQQKNLEEMAMKDGLTGLYNHKLIIELFNKECDKASRREESMAFVMLDIDFFKNVNDTFGHGAGDDVLKELADILENNIREGDIVGRYGGEEFCIVIPNTTENEVYKICERIRKAVEEHIFKTDEADIEITISIGACIKHPDNTLDCKEVITTADKALYIAKNSGRNKTVRDVLK